MQSARVAQSSPLAGWLPLAVLPLSTVALRNSLPAWQFMWILAFSIYAGLKWITWWKARTRIPHTAWRSAAYLLAWPGMDADSFLDATHRVPRPARRDWFWAFFETILGAIFIWIITPALPEAMLLLKGWAGMLGLILLLHFGSFQILSRIYQRLGVNAEPLMAAPLRSRSLSEFWGKRWNLGFRQLSYELIFRPTSRSLGAGLAGFLVFVASGLIHDLVISLPARAGYGLPTSYFLIQGLGVTVERSSVGKQLGLRRGARGWLFMAAVTGGPVFWLFHPTFVERVILPFMQAIHAL